jgi:hypothetical protein
MEQLRGTNCPAAGEGPTDGELLERFVHERDDAAFTELVRRHGPMVLGVCRRLLIRTEDVEDAFQATFMVLVRKAESIRKRDSAAWLVGWLAPAELGKHLGRAIAGAWSEPSWKLSPIANCKVHIENLNFAMTLYAALLCQKASGLISPTSLLGIKRLSAAVLRPWGRPIE